MFVPRQRLFPFSKRNRNPFSVLLSSFYCSTLLSFCLPITNIYNRHGPSYEANSYAGHQEISLILWDPGIHHKKDIRGSTLSQMNPVHILNAYLLGPLLTSERRGDALCHVSCPTGVALNFVYRIHHVFLKIININSDYFCKRN